MKTISNPYSTLTEKEFFALLVHASSGSSEDHKNRRVDGLEELQRRITSNSIQDKNEAIRILLDMAKKQGINQPESSLITESLTLLIKKYEEAFQAVLNGLGGHEDRLLLCFSKVVFSLDYNKKRQAIKPLVGFLTTRDVLNGIGVKEVYDCLVSLGNEKLGKEIVKIVSPHLDSSPLRICAIIFSVRLCSKFADHKLLPKMLKVLEKSMKGYFDGHSTEIEKKICQFLERIRDLQSLPLLMKLIKMRADVHISKVIASILDAHPYRVDDILDMLYDERDEKVIDAILQSFEEMDKTRFDARKLLPRIRINWWHSYPTSIIIYRLLVKWGELSKPALFEILQQNEKYDFALRCLKAIGISNEELSKIFPKPPMLQVYNFLYSHAQSKKIPKDLNQLWEETEKLQEIVPGKTDRLEHLLLHIFTSFNFVALNVAPLKMKSVDIVCFYRETLDLFIIGCTTGILKDDLQKMDALVKKMQAKTTELFDKCSVTPIVVSSEMASISPSDAQYAVQNNIVIMQHNHIDTLLEMLNTNRQSREVIEYIKGIYPNSATYQTV